MDHIFEMVDEGNTQRPNLHPKWNEAFHSPDIMPYHQTLYPHSHFFVYRNYYAMISLH